MTPSRLGYRGDKWFGYFLAGSILAHTLFVSLLFLYPFMWPHEQLSSIVINFAMQGGGGASRQQARKRNPPTVVVHRPENRMAVPKRQAVKEQAAESVTTRTAVSGQTSTAVSGIGTGGRGTGTGAGPGVVSSNELDSQPELVKFKDPVYPVEARRQGREGVVVLKALIAPDGRVKEVRVLKPVPLFDESAIDAVRQWRFTPLSSHGNPVYVWMIIPIRFRLR